MPIVPSKTKKQLPKSLRYATEQQWEIQRTRRHIRFRKGVNSVIAALTPSCYRADQNTLSRMKRHDFFDTLERQ